VEEKKYDVVIVGGGPAGLSAAAFCGRKFLRTAVFEGDCWGGILTRCCPDKRIDNYPGAPRGISAGDLAGLFFDGALEAGADLIECAVEEISPEGRIRATNVEATAKVVILACGSAAAEANIRGEREFAGRGGVHYMVPDPARFRGKRVVVGGGGDTAVSHVQRLDGIADRVTLVHRQAGLRSQHGFPEPAARSRSLDILLCTAAEEILGSERVESVRMKDLGDGRIFDVPADAVIVAAGRVPNTTLFRDLGLRVDSKGQVVTDAWQKTSTARILAVGDVSSPLKMIITAVAQAAAAAHEAYMEIRAPYWAA